MSNGPQYSDADVRAIIERALARSGEGTGVNHEDLLSIGEQVGLSRAAIERGAKELAAERLHNEVSAAITTTRRRWLALHALLFALINAVAFGINALTTPGEWWSLFSIVPWGLALALHVALALGLPVSEATIARKLAKRGAKSPRLRVEAGAAAHDAAEPSTTSEAAPRAERRA